MPVVLAGALEDVLDCWEVQPVIGHSEDGGIEWSGEYGIAGDFWCGTARYGRVEPIPAIVEHHPRILDPREPESPGARTVRRPWVSRLLSSSPRITSIRHSLVLTNS
jgi:hypothetical protein